MHDGGGNRSTTVKALPQIIAQLKEQGYSFVTVPELLELTSSPVKPTAITGDS
jgi:peptidoglycan/xylan/chitin deacetylase (PgdA/CDA1 family)